MFDALVRRGARGRAARAQRDGRRRPSAADGAPVRADGAAQGRLRGRLRLLHQHRARARARELAANPRCALLFPWHPLERQVRVDGVAAPLPRARSRPTSRPGRAAPSSAPGPRTSRGWSRRATSSHAAYDEARGSGSPAATCPCPTEWGGYARAPGGRGVLAGPARAGCTTGWSTGVTATAGAPSGWRHDPRRTPEGRARRQGRRPVAVVRRAGLRARRCTSRRCGGCTEVTGLVPVEYPTTRRLGATAAGPGGRPQRGLRRPGDPGGARDDRRRGPDHRRPAPRPRPGARRPQAVPRLQRQHQPAQLAVDPRASPGSTAARPRSTSAPDPAVDDVPRRASLRAALLTGERLEITEPGESEDFGKDWQDPAALTEYGDREPTEPWTWAGPAAVGHRADLGRLHRGPAVDPDRRPVPGGPGGARGRRPAARDLARSSSRPGVRLDPALAGRARPARRRRRGAWWRGRRPRTSRCSRRRASGPRRRAEQRDVAIETSQRYNPDAVVVVGVPFGHTRPQWILPYGGLMTVDGAEQRVWADYS